MMLDWVKTYYERLVDAGTALKKIRRGSRIFIGSACGEPQLLIRKLVELAPFMADSEIIHFLDLGDAAYTEARFNENFRHNALFIGANTRVAIQEGRADYTPVFLSEIPLLMYRGRMHLDVALITVSMPDNNGYVSLGVSVDITKTAAEIADYVVAEVNPNMPRTLGDSFIHVSKIDAFIENDAPMIEFHQAVPGETANKIAENIAELIEDGSTIQTGIGRIPSAVFPYLKYKKDLGVHTEVFTDGIIDLIEDGVITCARKTLHPNKIISSFCIGTRKLYTYINNNPLFEFHPAHYVNNPITIARNEKMISINAALTIDLTGQVCADSIGSLFYSGIGGQVDFVRGAAMSKGGKSIIVVPSVTDDGTKSRILPYLDQGSGVVLTRGDIHYAITEYGTAYLHGKTIRDRAMALINIAHPRFREELLAAAKELGYVYKDQVLTTVLYPEKYETYWHNKDGVGIYFRPVRPTDERGIQDLFYSLPKQDVYLRYFQHLTALPHKIAQPMVAIDYMDRMAIVGVVGKEEPENKEQIIAVGRYIRNPHTNLAEVAFTTHNAWQKKGIGTFLLDYLITIAREHNIRGFTADVLRTNVAMMRVFTQCGYTLKTILESGIYELEIKFEQSTAEGL